MDSDELWNGDLEGESRRDRKVTGEVFKMSIRNRKENTRLSRERGNTEGETEEQNGEESGSLMKD